MRRGLLLLIGLLYLLPAAWFLLANLSNTNVGYTHDDGIYFVTAKSLAQTGTYRLESLPGAPLQTKFPPLYPALLAAVWAVSPVYPANVPLAMLANWLAFPLYLFVAYRFFRERAVASGTAALLTLALAWNIATVYFSLVLMPDLLFAALVMAGWLLVSRPGRAAAIAGGFASAAAVLLKAAGLPLLPALAIYLVWRRRWMDAAAFTAAAAPVGLWLWWSGTHLPRTADPTLLYYLDYSGYERLLRQGADLVSRAVVNLKAVGSGLGSLLTPLPSTQLWQVALQAVLLLIALAGLFWKARRGVTPELFFAPALLALLLLRAYPPDLRTLLPLLPLLLLGLAHRRTLPVVAVVTILGLLATVFGIPTITQTWPAIRSIEAPALAWLRDHTPADARVCADHDPVVYLATGRHAERFQVPPAFRNPRDSRLPEYFRRLPEDLAFRGLQYLLLLPDSFDIANESRPLVFSILNADPRLQPVFRNAGVTVYRVAPPR